MSNSIVLRGEVQRSYAIKFIRELKIDADKPFVLTLEPYKKKRSLSQNALMWVRYGEVAKAIYEQTGTSIDAIHEYAKEQWLTPRIEEIGGKIIKIYSSKNLTTAQMTAFLKQFEAWASTEFGLMLADPDDRIANR